MSSVTSRQQLVSRLTDLLSAEGWTDADASDLPEEVQNALEWAPDKLLRNPQGQSCFLEIEGDINIPRWLVRTLKSNRDALQNAKIIVASVKDSPVDVETVKIALENNITVYADSSNPYKVIDPSLTLSSAPDQALKQAKQQFQRHKRIPPVLVETLKEVKNLGFSGILRQFAQNYENQEFDDWNEEQEFVRSFVMEHLAVGDSTEQLLQGLDVLSMLEEVSEIMTGKRPHFLHSFQTFVLGSMMIDRNYDLFNEVFNDSFTFTNDIKIDVPWLLTSLFHDIAVPFENISRLGPVGRVIGIHTRGIHATYTPHLLGCWFNSICNEHIGPGWEALPSTDGGPLCDLLMQNRVDHGVLGAITLVHSAGDLEQKTLASIICPAAHAVAIHNCKLWPAILDCGFPVSARRFPLAYLLLVCDNLQEWGREKLVSRLEPEEPKTLVLGGDFAKPLGDFSIWVSELATAILLMNRSHWINSRLFTVENLEVHNTFNID